MLQSLQAKFNQHLIFEMGPTCLFAICCNTHKPYTDHGIELRIRTHDCYLSLK